MENTEKRFTITHNGCVWLLAALCILLLGLWSGPAQAAGWNGLYGVEPGDTVYLGTKNDDRGVAWRVLSLPGDDQLPVSGAGKMLLLSKYTQGTENSAAVPPGRAARRRPGARAMIRITRAG